MHTYLPLKAKRTPAALIPAGHSSIGNFQGLLEWHKMSPMVRAGENFLTEVNIQWNHKEKRMQKEEENVLGLAVRVRDRFCKTRGWDRKLS